MTESKADRIIAALERHHLKMNRARTKGRCNSPLRPGSNSHAFAITIDPDAPGGGVWYDHVTKEGGDFLDLEQLLPGFVAPTPSTPAATPSRITTYASLEDYAQAQGAPVAVWHAAGWRKGTYYCSVHRRERPALLFETKTGTRARFIDGLKPKYMSPAGYRRTWYRLDEAVHIAQATEQPLVICNGEASALVAQYFGVAATAITGGGENDIPDALLEELHSVYQGPISIALDSDETGRTSSARMAATLGTAGYAVRAVDLNGDKGFDLANFAKLHQLDTPAALQALKDLPAAPPDVTPLEVLRLRAENARLLQTIADQQREIEALKAEQRAQNDLIQNDKISATDKITILMIRRELAVQAPRLPTPEAPRPVNLTAQAERTGQSVDTVSRCVKKFKGILWERQVIKARDETTGEPRTIIQLAPLPALEDLRTIAPAEPRKHGGHHPKKLCADCGSADLLEETRIVCRTCGCQQGETQYAPVNLEPAEEPAPPAIPDPVPQVAAHKNDIQVTTPSEQSFSPVPQVAAQGDPPRVRCICGGWQYWGDNAWHCDSCRPVALAPPVSRAVLAGGAL